MNNGTVLGTLGLAMRECRMREKCKPISNTKGRYNLSLDPIAPSEKMC